MATNKVAWVRNLHGDTKPLIMLGKFETGQAIKRGEIIELTADTNTSWVPMDSDFDAVANLAVANEEIKSGDRMGFYEIIVPRPGDVFEFAVEAGAAIAIGTAMTWSDSQTLTTGGTYAVGYAVGQEHYPLKQGHVTDDAGPDRGETIRSISYVRMVFRLAASYFALWNK